MITLGYLNSCLPTNDIYSYLYIEIFRFYILLTSYRIITTHLASAFLLRSSPRADGDSSWSTGSWDEQLPNPLLAPPVQFWLHRSVFGSPAPNLAPQYQ